MGGEISIGIQGLLSDPALLTEFGSAEEFLSVLEEEFAEQGIDASPIVSELSKKRPDLKKVRRELLRIQEEILRQQSGRAGVKSSSLFRRSPRPRKLHINTPTHQHIRTKPSSSTKAVAKSIAASAAFAATNLIASAALAQSAEGMTMDPHRMLADDLSSLWLILLGLVSPVLEGFVALVRPSYPIMVADTTQQPSSITVDGKPFAHFDSAVGYGQWRLQNSYNRLRRMRYSSLASGALMVFGGTATLVANNQAAGWGPLGIGVFIAAVGSLLFQEKWNSRAEGRYTPEFLKATADPKHFRHIGVAKEKTKKVSPLEMASWLNVVHDAARVAATSERDEVVTRGNGTTKTFPDWFEEVLKTGLRVEDVPNKRVYDYVEMMGEQSLLPLLEWALESPNGYLVFQAVCKYNATARKMGNHPSILENRKVNWKKEDCNHPNALEAMRWLVQRGNKDVLALVGKWKEEGSASALSLWNRYHGIQAELEIPTSPEGARGGGSNSSAVGGGDVSPSNTPKHKIKGLEGQPQATEWLATDNEGRSDRRSCQKSGQTSL